MTHSIIPPSSAYMWGAPGGCTGWVLMSLQYPETEESDESMEGTAAHEIAVPMIEAYQRGVLGMPTRQNLADTLTTNGVVATDEMYDGAKMYADYLGELMRDTNVYGGEYLGVEDRIEAPQIHNQSFGTVDFWLFDVKNGVLYIVDFKFGRRFVAAYENWQLINYVAGVLKRLGLDDQVITVCMIIVQPRAYHPSGPVREWRVKASDLRPYFNILANNAERALGDNSELRTGKHCRDCQARHACPAALDAGLGLYESVNKPTPVDLSPLALGVHLAVVRRAREQLEYLETGLEKEVEKKIKGGIPIPLWVLEQTYGRRKWTAPVEEVISMGVLLEKDIQKPIEAITPTQAIALGIDDTVIEEYSTKPRGKMKLAYMDSNHTKRIFEK